MLNLLIVDKNRVANHVGEEYDDYLEVDMIIDPEKMPSVVNIIRNNIRQIFIEADEELKCEQCKNPDNDGICECNGETVKREISIIIDASPIYNVMVVSLSEIMLKDEKINLVLSDKLDMEDRTNEFVEERN